MQQILGVTFNEVKEQLEKACIIPNNIPTKTYAERLDRETSNIYRALQTYKKYVKYPLEITVLDYRPTGRHCVYSVIDGKVLDGHGTGIEKQYIYICPYSLVCPFHDTRVTVARIAEDIHSYQKSKACRKQKTLMPNV